METFNLRDFDELERRAKDELETVQRKVEAIRLVRSMLNEQSQAIDGFADQGSPSAIDHEQHEDHRGPAVEKKSAEPIRTLSLIGAVERVVNDGPGQIWDISLVEHSLKNAGFQFNTKSPRLSISTALKKLSRRGDVKLVRKGSGNAPNKYRASKP